MSKRTNLEDQDDRRKFIHPYEVLATLVANGFIPPTEMMDAAEVLEDKFEDR